MKEYHSRGSQYLAEKYVEERQQQLLKEKAEHELLKLVDRPSLAVRIVRVLQAIKSTYQRLAQIQLEETNESERESQEQVPSKPLNEI